MSEYDDRVIAAQDASHDADHAYEIGSPHLQHRSIRSDIEARLGDQVRATIAARGDAQVLEIGAGHGTFTDHLLAAGASVQVTEASRASYERLCERFADDDRVSVVHDESGTDVLADTGRFDGVVCISVLHHIPDYVAFTERLVELVRPGGWFFSVQDPLYYPRRSRASHVASRGSYFLWRLRYGNYRRGLRTRWRRFRGVWSETEPSDLVEYHVVRHGVDELALERALEPSFADVEVFRYWSTQSALFQRLGERLPLLSDFGILAVGRAGPDGDQG